MKLISEIFKQIKNTLYYFYKQNIQYSMDIFHIIKILIFSNIIIFFLNPYSSLYSGIYLTYSNYKTEQSIQKLRTKLYLLDAKILALQNNSSDFLEELYLSQGKPYNNEQILFLE